MTVSRALSDSPQVHPKTREAVRLRAAELGYVKSAAATAMRGDGTRIVGLLVPNLVNEFYARFANALALLCEDNDLHLITHLTNDDPDRELLTLNKLRELQASAVIMVPAPSAETHDPRLFQGMNTIQFIRTQPLPVDSGSLVVQDANSIKEAVHLLVRKGHKRISYLGAHSVLSSGRQRLTAFSEAMRENDLEPAPELLQTAAPSFQMGADKAKGILSGDIEASAIVCGGFEISNGALDACLQARVDMPGDLAFVGYGDPSFYQWIGGGVTTIALPIETLANQALALLSPSAPVNGPQEHAYKTELIVRATT